MICTAIKKKRILHFGYEGSLRDVESYVHGYTSEGREVLQAYEIKNYTTGETGWRVFDVAKIYAFGWTEIPFLLRTDFEEGREVIFLRIHCQVDRLEIRKGHPHFREDGLSQSNTKRA